MPGSGTYTPASVPLDLDAIPLRVALYDRDAVGDFRYTTLPNVRPLQIQYFQGARPPAARFEYVFDDHDPTNPYPTQFEQVWPLSAPPIVGQVKQDDEITVWGTTSAGVDRLIFHGFAQVPQVDVHGRGQAVTFTALDVACRYWDAPVGGALYRDGDDPDTGKAVPTDLPVRFNPDRQPNCTPDGQDVNEGSTDPTKPPYPLFLDERLQRAPDPRTFWTLDKLARYLMAVYNADQTYVENPDFGILTELLKSRRPVMGDYYDPNDSTTYTEDVVVVRDTVATGKAWPDVLEEQLGYAGFGMAWRCEEDPTTLDPYHYLEIYRLDAASPYEPKQVTLPVSRSRLDIAYADLAAFSAARDHNELANQFRIETDPILYEVSVVLAPWFTIAAGDADLTARQAFLASNLVNATADVRRKYRVYVADEAADGHWLYGGGAMDTTTPLNLDDLLGKPDPTTGVAAYVKRLRPGKATLITTDGENRPRRAELAISTDYAGNYPALWDGTGTWQSCGQDGWRLLRDRLGIEITAEDPEAWAIPRPAAGAGGPATMDVRGVTAQAAPTAFDPYKRFFLRLTCVIEGDKMLAAVATKRDASPSKFALERRIDARDHYTQWVVARDSLYGDVAGPKIERDDTDAATSLAAAMRSAHEFPHFGGALTIPSLTNAFIVGDRINQINGRNVDLIASGGAGAGESPRYPAVVALTWDFSQGGQRTVLQLDDRRAEAQAPSSSVLTGAVVGRDRV